MSKRAECVKGGCETRRVTVVDMGGGGFSSYSLLLLLFFFQAEDGIRDRLVTGVQTCALPIWHFAEVWAAIDTRLDREVAVNTTLSFSQEVACSADLQLHAPYWPEANKPHGNRLSHANREDGMCEDILVDKVVLVLLCHLRRWYSTAIFQSWSITCLCIC